MGLDLDNSVYALDSTTTDLCLSVFPWAHFRIYVMDRGYADSARLNVLQQAGAFFVTRAKSNMDARRVTSAPSERSIGIICDQAIVLAGIQTRQHYPEHLRRIRFKDPETGKALVFLTNQHTLPAATTCALYKSRRGEARLRHDGRSSCSSNGSSSICAS